MAWFLNSTTKYKNLDNFPNGWTGKELIELAEDLESSGMMLKIEGYTGYAPYITFCSNKLCYNYDQLVTQQPYATEFVETTTYIY
jgi:hypothetical protein